MDLNLPGLIIKPQVHLICKLQEIRVFIQGHTQAETQGGQVYSFSGCHFFIAFCVGILVSAFGCLSHPQDQCVSGSVLSGPTCLLEASPNCSLVNINHVLASGHFLLLPKSTQISIRGTSLPRVYDPGACFAITEGKEVPEVYISWAISFNTQRLPSGR